MAIKSPELINDLAEFIATLPIDKIPLTQAEMFVLFKIQGKEAFWNIKSSYITYLMDGKPYLVPPIMLLANPLSKNTWHPYAHVSAILNLLLNNLGFSDTLQKLVMVLSSEFEYLSEGQARALLKRTVSITLEAGERNQLSRLRKKMEGYRKLLNSFGTRVQRSSPGRKMIEYERDDPLTPVPDHSTWVSSIQEKIQFFCRECKTLLPVNVEIKGFPKHHNEVMTLKWNIYSKSDDTIATMKELSDAISSPSLKKPRSDPNSRLKTVRDSQAPKLYCTICSERFEIPKELEIQLANTNGKIDLPMHHNKEMEIVINTTNKAQAGIAIIQKMLAMNIKNPGLYFACAECEYFIEYADVMKDPETGEVMQLMHHDKKMMTISYGGKSE